MSGALASEMRIMLMVGAAEKTKGLYQVLET